MYEKKENYGVTHSRTEWKKAIEGAYPSETYSDYQPVFIDAIYKKKMHMTCVTCTYDDVAYQCKNLRGTLAELLPIIEQESTIPYALLRSTYPVFDKNGQEIFVFRGYFEPPAVKSVEENKVAEVAPPFNWKPSSSVTFPDSLTLQRLTIHHPDGTSQTLFDQTFVAAAARQQNSLNELAQKQFAWVERMGWHNKTVLEALALIGSEVGEAVNECRGDKPTENFATELADIILRTLDLAEWQGIDLEKVLLTKMALNEKNGTRGRRV